MKPRRLLALPSLLCLISWSPTDPVIEIGSNNTTTGASLPGQYEIDGFRGLVAGWGNTVGVHMAAGASSAVVLGYGNEANLYASLLAGADNTVAPLANPTDSYTYLFYSGIFGRLNIVEEGTYNSLLAGYANNVTARNSLVIGMANTIYNTNPSTHSNYSAAIGNANLINAQAGWAIGNGNTLDKNGGINMVAIGTGLLNTNDRAIALGRWNASMGANDMFVIGSGTSANNRNTALSVSNSGEVKIPGLFTVTGASSFAATTSGALTVTGNTTLQGATTAQNLTVSGNSTLQGTITAANLSATGSSTLAGVTAASLGVTGPSTMAAVTATTLTATGNTSLASASAASLSVTGTTTLAGDTLLQGDVTLAQPQGDISMGIYE